MRTWLLDDIQALKDDGRIMASLRSEASVDVPGGVAYLMGVRNVDGMVYRLVQAQGVGEMARLVKALQKLGFIEERVPDPGDGPRSTFSRYGASAEKSA